MLFKEFLEKIASELITTEWVLYSVGVSLKVAVDDITTIRTDNYRNIRQAGQKLLIHWMMNSTITKLTGVHEALREAFTFSNQAEKFQEISASKMRKEGTLICAGPGNSGVEGLFWDYFLKDCPY